MLRRKAILFFCLMAVTMAVAGRPATAQQPCACGNVAGGAYGTGYGGYGLHDCERFYHYPYVYYPHNFWGNEYYRSSNDLYYRYPQEMRVPVYNKQWHNYYPEKRRYHWGHHFELDVF